MKKQFLFLAGAAIMFASCGSNENKEQGPSQAQLDSTVKAQVEQHDREAAAKNDSIVNARAKEVADSTAKAMEEASHKGGTKKTTKTTKSTTTTSTTTTTPPPPVVPASGPRAHADQSTKPAGDATKPASGGGPRSHADQVKK